ncbi:hypothetical protein D1007_19750 [Hordeum vulgare]|nr:hypothetical protein D1007_19750 [Hordeum vulgare]
MRDDGVSVMQVAKRPPELQVSTKFGHRVRSTTKRNVWNNKLIVDSPQHPGQDSHRQPPSVADRQGHSLKFSEQQVCVAPGATDHFAETTPEELRGHAIKEDVVRILFHRTNRTNAIPWPVPLKDLDTRGDASTKPLSEEYPDLQGEPNFPEGRERLDARGRCNCLV